MFDDEEEDAIQEDQPTPAMGWTTKIWYKSGCESSISHHRLMGILQTYYAVGTQLWSISMKNIRTLWRILIRRLGCASPSGMKRRNHTS